MRDVETIDADLRLRAAVHRACREECGVLPPMTLVNELLDERGELNGGITGGCDWLKNTSK